MLNEYKNKNFLEISKDLNVIPVDKFIGILRERPEQNQKLLKSNNVLRFLHEYREIISNNVIITSQFKEIAQNFILILRYNTLLKEKESQAREIELSTHYKKSSDIKASNDLLKKLSESVAKNKNKLEFLEEDYFQRKNQIENIQKKIHDLNKKIQDLTEQKKRCFSEINKITRNMSGDTQDSKNKVKFNKVNSQSNLTNAEIIKSFQLKAKEIQFEINTIKSKTNQIQLSLDDLIPNFEIYEKDYLNILDIINTEEKRIKDLQSELKERIKDDKNIIIKEVDLSDLNAIRPLREIRDSIEKIDLELKKLVIPEDYYNPQNPRDLSLIIRKLTELNQSINKSDSEIIITIKEKDIYDCLEQFRELENLLNKIEIFTNKFLPEINLKSRFRIVVPENYKSFFIYIEFIRKETDYINFEELTTPEKIFFIIVFYLSIKLLFNKNNIIFSNVSILSQYNKAGSIYRAIRKILPVFEMEEEFTKYNIIFILSNLELKEEIKNLKAITIKKS